MKTYIVYLDCDYCRIEVESTLNGKCFDSLSEVKNICETKEWNAYTIIPLDEFINDINDEMYPTCDWVVYVTIKG